MKNDLSLLLVINLLLSVCTVSQADSSRHKKGALLPRAPQSEPSVQRQKEAPTASRMNAPKGSSPSRQTEEPESAPKDEEGIELGEPVPEGEELTDLPAPTPLD